jgi:hypothetical protein
VIRLAAVVVALAVLPAYAITPEAKEFIAISKKLEPVQCEKRKLRREMAVAEIGREEARLKELRGRFAALDRNPETTKHEKRLGELERRMSNGRGGTLDPEDLDAISLQHREAFYRCE